MKFWQGGYAKAGLGFYRSYWLLRKKLATIKSYFWGGAFGVRERASNTAEDATYVGYLAKGAILSVALAILFVLGFHLFDNSISDFVVSHGWQNRWLGQVVTRRMDSTAYDQLLGTVTAITGVFIALYFTAVNTVVANVYSKMPSNIRSLIIQDRVGNVYVRAATFLTALSAILLAVHALGTPPFHLAPVVVIILLCFAIFAFTKLGERAFYLADPTLLAGIIAPNFFKWARRSSMKGWWWRSKDLQNTNSINGRRALNALSALVKVSSNQSHLQGDSYPRLINKTSLILINYLSMKYQIPTNSGWFGQKYLHKQWYLVESTELEMASQTDSSLRPNEVPDEFWVESSLLQSVLEAVGVSSTNISYEQLYSKLSMLPSVMDAMGQSWSAEEGERWCNKITEKLIGGLVDNPPDPLYVKSASVNGVIDTLASLPLSLEIGFAKAVDTLDIPDIKNAVMGLDLSTPQAPYSLKLPRRAIVTLEQIQKSILFEQRVNPEKTITPSWYTTELVLNSIDWSLFDQWKVLMKLIDSWYVKNGDKLVASDLNIAASAVYGRALELSWKLDRHIIDLRAKVEELQKNRLLDLEIPPWKWEDLQKEVKAFRLKVIERIAKSIPKLMPDEPTPDLPDYFGAAVHRTGEACFQALEDDDIELFKKLFVPYFGGILETANKIRPQVIDWDPKTAVTWFSEPIIDLFEISGYAYIFSELYGKPEYWVECTRIWDTYLSEDPASKLQFLAGISAHHQRLFALTPRATLRTSRQFALERRLGALPRQPRDQNMHPFDEPAVQHDSEFIKRIAPRGDMPMFVDSIDVFIVKYLMPLPEAKDLDFGTNDSKVDQIQSDQEADNE